MALTPLKEPKQDKKANSNPFYAKIKTALLGRKMSGQKYSTLLSRFTFCFGPKVKGKMGGIRRKPTHPILFGFPEVKSYANLKLYSKTIAIW